MQTSLCRSYRPSRYVSQLLTCLRRRNTTSIYLSILSSAPIVTPRRRAIATTTATLRYPPPLSFPPSMMNRKRAAPSSAVTASSTASPSASKKRKTDNVQKFYAVQVGFRPGVYTTYAECAQQTAGFKGALCTLRDVFAVPCCRISWALTNAVAIGFLQFDHSFQGQMLKHSRLVKRSQPRQKDQPSTTL